MEMYEILLTIDELEEIRRRLGNGDNRFNQKFCKGLLSRLQPNKKRLYLITEPSNYQIKVLVNAEEFTTVVNKMSKYDNDKINRDFSNRLKTQYKNIFGLIEA